MSGGVDSSVAAWLLALRRRSLVGFSMQLVDRLAGEVERYGRCCCPDDFRDARAVADRIGIPHYILDMEKEFHREVLRPFVEDYASGRTPSPCVRCNTHVKFGALLGRARAIGAERVATGHYAILEPDPATGRTLLRRARDLDKDQSYFLFDLTEEQRGCAEFPLGRLTKDEVRELARAQGLAVADKPESMDLCFVSRDESYRDVLGRWGLDRDAPAPEAGEIVDRAGNVLGRHAGVVGFTVGQRRGIGLSAARPLYVLGIDPAARRVVVGHEEELLRDRCVIERSRWIPFERPGGEVRAQVRIRSTHGGSPATVRGLGDGRAEIRFDDPQRAIAPGQAAVAYDGDLVLGGGWIAS
jgi:tRNA-specific 2-thiouridylase